VDGTLNRFIYSYYIQHLPAFQAFKGPSDFISGFHDDEKLWSALTEFAAKDTVNLQTVPEREKQVLQRRLKALLARQIWRSEGYYEVSNLYDPAIAKALDVVRK
jgi:carboxyl-terminal processing protease